MKQNNKTIILYSWSTVWSMKNQSGAPSFYKTIDLYIKKGWDVHLVLVDATKGAMEMAENCQIHVMSPWRTDSLISEKNITKPFLLLKMLRYYCYSKKITRQIMKNNKNDVLFYAYEIHGVSSAKWASKKYQAPLVTRFQGTVATYFKDNFATRVKQYFHLKALKEKADLVIMTDDGTKGLETLKKLGNPSENIRFWRNGLDLLAMQYHFSDDDKRALRTELGIAEDECMLLTVSRLQGWKKVDRAVRALHEVNKNNKKCKLVIAGDGPERSNLEKLVQQYGLESYVIFLGAVAHDKVYDYMSCADIFLSLYDMSNVGNPLLEALTLGKCIITLDVGDTGAIIEDGVNGVLLSPEALDCIPSAILELCNRSELRKQLEENASSYAEKHFYTWDTRMEMEYCEVTRLL